MWKPRSLNVVLLLQGVDGKDGEPGPAGDKGDKVRLIDFKLACIVSWSAECSGGTVVLINH